MKVVRHVTALLSSAGYKAVYFGKVTVQTSDYNDNVVLFIL